MSTFKHAMLEQAMIDSAIDNLIVMDYDQLNGLLHKMLDKGCDNQKLVQLLSDGAYND